MAESARTAISTPCCCVPQDAGRLEYIANYLDDSIYTPDKQTDPFHFTFLSNDNVYEVSFETYQDKLKDGSISTDSELSVCVWMKLGNLFYRLYCAAKYLSGYCSCYGDFDSFEFVQNDAWKLHRMVSGLRAC